MFYRASLSETVGRLQRQLDLAECEKLALVDSNKELLVVVNNLRSELQGSGGVIGELKYVVKDGYFRLTVFRTITLSL